MALSNIREELLEHHNEIRRLCTETLGAVERARRAESGAHAALRSSVLHLVDTIQAHNAREDELLIRLLPTIDAWGAERTRRMCEHHLREDADSIAALATSARPGDDRHVAAILDDVLEHMALEEQEFLRADVLDDDTYDTDAAFGG
jgi:hypothetical protein